MVTLFLALLLLERKRKICWLPMKQTEKLIKGGLFNGTLAAVPAPFHLNKMRRVRSKLASAEKCSAQLLSEWICAAIEARKSKCVASSGGV